MSDNSIKAARDDLADYIEEQITSGDAERDPYTFTTDIIRVAIEYAMDDGIVNAMGEDQADMLYVLANVIMQMDHALYISVNEPK